MPSSRYEPTRGRPCDDRVKRRTAGVSQPGQVRGGRSLRRWGVALNPVRAHLVALAGDYPRSSYRAMTREGVFPEWLERRAILAMFGQTEEQAIASYRAFVDAGASEPSPWQHLKRQALLGSMLM